MGPRSAAGGRSNQSFLPPAQGPLTKARPRKRGSVRDERSRCTIASRAEMKQFPRLAMLVVLLAAAGCGGSGGAVPDQAEPVDAQHVGQLGRLPADAARKASPDAALDTATEDAPTPVDLVGPRDVTVARDGRGSGDHPCRGSFDGGGREGGPSRMCMAGAMCGPNARCERSCQGQQIYRCTCAEGHFVCTGCIGVDGGVRDVGGAGTCAGNVSLQGRRCDHAGDVCQYTSNAGAGQRLCACGDVGPQRLWICQ
jgi:hypothetical protein